jgi:AcrR family transcriptional regulator
MPKPDVSETRRAQIIKAAIAVFLRQGYHKTNMPDIARQAGLSIGGVYWYFKSKNDIITHILEQIYQADLKALDQLLVSDTPAPQRVRAYLHQYIEDYQQFSWLNFIGIQFYGEAMYDPHIQEFIQAYFGRYRQALAALIQQGIERGEFKPVNPQVLANVLIALDEGLSLLLATDPQNSTWKESFMTGAELLLAGLSTHPNP